MTEDQEFELLEKNAANARVREMEIKAWDACHKFVAETSMLGGMTIAQIFQLAYIQGYRQADRSRSTVAK